MNNAFIVSSKAKTHIVFNDEIGQAQVFSMKDLAISEFNMTFPSQIPMYTFGSRNAIDYVERGTYDIDIKMHATNIESRLGNIKPEDLYSIPELNKLSKIITKRLEKV